MKLNNLLSKSLLFVGLAASFLSDVSFSQQDPLFTMHYFNPLVVNPAVAGSRDALSVTLLGRKQWVGINGAPTTGTFSIHTPFKNESFAMGFTAFYDEIGENAIQTNALFLDGAYRIKLNTSVLSFGLKAGVRLFSANLSSLTAIDPNDPSQVNVSNRPLPNFGAGAYWYGTKHFVGLSAPKLLDNPLTTAPNSGTEKRHFFLTGGYTFDISSVIEFQPSVALRTVFNAPISTDINLNFLFYEKLWIGAGVRGLGDADKGIVAAVGNVMFHFSPTFRAGYAYDYSLSSLSTYNTGSHEIMVNYDLDFLGKGFKTPRRF